ncbi:unnamed protein product [Ectocarpus fasciculatus]
MCRCLDDTLELRTNVSTHSLRRLQQTPFDCGIFKNGFVSLARLILLICVGVKIERWTFLSKKSVCDLFLGYCFFTFDARRHHCRV